MDYVRARDKYANASISGKDKSIVDFEEAKCFGAIFGAFYVGVELKVVEVAKFVSSISLVANSFYSKLWVNHFVYYVEKGNGWNGKAEENEAWDGCSSDLESRCVCNVAGPFSFMQDKAYESYRHNSGD